MESCSRAVYRPVSLYQHDWCASLYRYDWRASLYRYDWRASLYRHGACAEPSRSCTPKKWSTLCSKIFRKSATSATNVVLFVELFVERQCISRTGPSHCTGLHSAHVQNLLEAAPPKCVLLCVVRFLERVPQVPQVPQMCCYLCHHGEIFLNIPVASAELDENRFRLATCLASS